MTYLAPSILSADFAKLGEDIKTISASKAQWVHIDVMDGAFVPNISFGAPIIKAIRPLTDKIFDVHLMVDEPGRFIPMFAEAGADLITVHAEACCHLDGTIEQIKKLGLKAGVALNPATSLSVLDYILDKVDMVLIMSVNPGFGGQSYIESATEKIKNLKEKIEAKGVSVLIEVDGGVTPANVCKVVEAGADVVVAGSAVFKGNIENNIDAFFHIFKNDED